MAKVKNLSRKFIKDVRPKFWRKTLKKTKLVNCSHKFLNLSTGSLFVREQKMIGTRWTSFLGQLKIFVTKQSEVASLVSLKQ